jgi:hypothetical protein
MLVISTLEDILMQFLMRTASLDMAIWGNNDIELAVLGGS